MSLARSVEAFQGTVGQSERGGLRPGRAGKLPPTAVLFKQGQRLPCPPCRRGKGTGDASAPDKPPSYLGGCVSGSDDRTGGATGPEPASLFCDSAPIGAGGPGRATGRPVGPIWILVEPGPGGRGGAVRRLSVGGRTLVRVAGRGAAGWTFPAPGMTPPPALTNGSAAPCQTGVFDPPARDAGEGVRLRGVGVARRVPASSLGEAGTLSVSTADWEAVVPLKSVVISVGILSGEDRSMLSAIGCVGEDPRNVIENA